MNLVGFVSTAVLSLTLIAAAPMYAQEQHEQEEQKAKPEEKKAQPEKAARQEEKPAAQQEKNTKQAEKSKQQQAESGKREEKTTKQEDKNSKQEEKSAQQQQHAQQAQRSGGNGGGRIPDDRFRANFGQEHTFHVSEGDYRNHRFQYGGYWFGFADAWPSDSLYTQDVFVVEINGVYYLCNPMYPGINIELSFTL